MAVHEALPALLPPLFDHSIMSGSPAARPSNARVQAAAAARAALKAQRRDLQSLDALAAEADAEEAASVARRSRLAADRAEREKTEPPRLGKHRFQAAPVQVRRCRGLLAWMACALAGSLVHSICA